jgi:hypothetical protein
MDQLHLSPSKSLNTAFEDLKGKTSRIFVSGGGGRTGEGSFWVGGWGAGNSRQFEDEDDQ